MRRNSLVLNWALIPAAIALVVLLVVSLFALQGRNPDESGVSIIAPSTALHPAAEQTRQFFGWPLKVQWLPLTNAANPFFTLAIQPTPPPKPPPPPPTTRKVDVTYRGFIETSAGVRRAVVQVGDTQVLGRKGDKIVADFAVDEIELKTLQLTNPAGQKVVIDFAKSKPLEVPAK